VEKKKERALEGVCSFLFSKKKRHERERNGRGKLGRGVHRDTRRRRGWGPKEGGLGDLGAEKKNRLEAYRAGFSERELEKGSGGPEKTEPIAKRNEGNLGEKPLQGFTVNREFPRNPKVWAEGNREGKCYEDPATQSALGKAVRLKSKRIFDKVWKRKKRGSCAPELLELGKGKNKNLGR